MEPTDWIAIYAGLVATGTLIWQIIARSRDRRPRLTVYLSGMYHIEDATDTAAFVEYHEAENEPLPVPCSLEIEVTNIGRETVTVTNAAIEALVTANETHNFAPSGELPWTLKRGDRESFAIEIAPGPIRKSTTFQAEVTLTTGETFSSPPLEVGGKGWLVTLPLDFYNELGGYRIPGVYQMIVHDITDYDDE